MRTVQSISSILENIGVTEEEYIEMSLRMLEVFQALPFDLSLSDVDDYDRSLFESNPLNKIHPRKRAIVEALIKTRKPAYMKKIIVFGSATTLYCREDSDLDLLFLIDGEQHHKDVHRWLKSNFDYFHRDVLICDELSYVNLPHRGIKQAIDENSILIWES